MYVLHYFITEGGPKPQGGLKPLNLLQILSFMLMSLAINCCDCRKICQNCRCGKDDHEVEDEDEDIGQFVIGKLFERPARTKKEELEYSYGTLFALVFL